ncbi:MAG: DJ-1/PfpI family protein [Eubacteriales bacterium]|nr:DJ-1/PfpI family protein [Eubacteriales bacterium]
MKDLLVILAKGFEEIEALTVVDYLRRAGAEVRIASAEGDLHVESSHGVVIRADAELRQLDPNEFRALYLPGGMPGAANLAGNAKVRAWVTQFNHEKKLIAAICAAPMVLDALGILRENHYTCYPGFEERLKTKGRLDKILVQDGHIWTAMGPALAQYLALELAAELKGMGAREKLRAELLYPELTEVICR